MKHDDPSELCVERLIVKLVVRRNSNGESTQRLLAVVRLSTLWMPGLVNWLTIKRI